ncbi:MAG: sulfite exporter TauE/SafE family protein [Acidobacteriota bacterium]
MHLWQYELLALLGLLTGVLNVLAGGGSLLTLPFMIFMGMSPAVANGTNRIALLGQNISAVASFRRKGFSDFKLSLTLGLCTLPGAVLGALAAADISPIWFKRLLALVMIGVLVEVLRPKRDGKGLAAHRVPHRAAAHLSMVAVGFYGGFVQAGVGFILMALLQGLLALDLVRVNMHKVFIIGLYMIPSLAVFAILGDVRWVAGLVLAAGNAAGAWLGATVSVRGGERVIKFAFALAVLATAIKLLLGAA